MNNIILKIKNIFLNRNTVTILGVIAGVIVLWFAYTITLNKAIDPKRVPVASKDITAGTIITKDDIEYVEINADVLKKARVITSSAALIGKYVNNGTSIAKGAMFYQDQVVPKSDLVERELETIPKGYTMYWLKVDNTSTYANSIYPGDKIDLWLKANVEGSLVYEEFITSIEVLSVKDSSSQNVFDVSGSRTPNWLAFAVPVEIWTYLKNIETLSGLQLFPVPKNKMYTVENAPTEISNLQLKYYIDSLVSIKGNTTTPSTGEETTPEVEE